MRKESTMKYIRTQMATDWPEKESLMDKLIRVLLFFIAEANPGYRNKMHQVTEWLIEFDEEGSPIREIGIGARGVPVLVGPYKNDYGYWCDTNMTYKDFEGEDVEQSVFEDLWVKSRMIE